MTDNTPPKNQTIDGRCPVCGVKLVRILEHGTVTAIAHSRPLCSEYKKLNAKEFSAKYLLN